MKLFTDTTHLVVVLVGATLFKKPIRLRHFKSDRDEICTQDCSSGKYASIASAGLLISRWQPLRHCSSEGGPGLEKP